MRTLQVHGALSWLVLLILGFPIHVANAQDIELYDDFEDGDLFDGEPVDWNSSITNCTPGFNKRAENGVARLCGGTSFGYFFANQEFQGDVSMRLRGRVIGWGSITAGLHWTWPGCPGAFSEYVAGVKSQGHDIPIPCLEGDAYLFRWGGGVPPCGLLDSRDFPDGFDVTETFFLQMDVRGDFLELRLWRPGEPFPQEPLLQGEDTNLRSGHAGIVGENCVELDFMWIRNRMIGADDVPPDERSPLEIHFRRGDANADGDVNIADASSILNTLFGDGPAVICSKASDANDDAEINIADGIYVLNGLFGAGSALPAPHPDCGVDPTEDALPCDAFPACP